jgi:hypothetical protein
MATPLHPVEQQQRIYSVFAKDGSGSFCAKGLAKEDPSILSSTQATKVSNGYLG